MNNGTGDPFNGVTPINVGTAQDTPSIALADMDGDGGIDVLEGNLGQANRLFVRQRFDTALNIAGFIGCR